MGSLDKAGIYPDPENANVYCLPVEYVRINRQRPVKGGTKWVTPHIRLDPKQSKLTLYMDKTGDYTAVLYRDVKTPLMELGPYHVTEGGLLTVTDCNPVRVTFG